MNRLKQLLKRPLAKAATHHVAIVLVVALVGFGDSVFLAVEHFRGVVPPCTTVGCDIVLTSSFSEFMGLPVALFGALYYLAIALSALIFLEARHLGKALRSHHFEIIRWAMLATVGGLAASVYFTFVQAFVLRSFCQYCLGSAVTSLVLFIMAVVILRKNENA